MNTQSKLDVKPVYDEKVKAVLREMATGKSLVDIAKDMNYGNSKSLDIYMRRRNFHMNKGTGNYEPIGPERDTGLDLPASSKVGQIIAMLDSEGADPKIIAKRLGFSDHQELAHYMMGKGYAYDSSLGNYRRKLGVNEAASASLSLAPTGSNEAEPVVAYKNDTSNGINPAQWQEYMEILEILRRNKAQLLDKIILPDEGGKIPMYAIGGTFVTKSVHMSNLLDQMVRNFAQEKNVNQRTIFEVALIEFFRNYGYGREVQSLLGQ